MKNLSILLIISYIFISCSSGGGSAIVDTNSDIIITETSYDWTVPLSDIAGSNSPFPLAINPSYTLANQVNFISDDEKVALVSFNDGIVKAFPFFFTSTYESVNDIIGSFEVSMTYCPITQSALLIDRRFDNDNTFILRASGVLYKENMVAIDESTQTYWSQFLLKCIKGKFQNEPIKTFNFVETRWSTVKKYFPNAQVFTNTSVNKSNQTPSSKSNIENADVVYGILENSAKNETPKIHAFEYNLFDSEIKILNKQIHLDNILVIGSQSLNFITSYINDSNAQFTAIQGQFPIIMSDSNGNKWDVFGIAVDGPRKGEKLKSLRAFFGSWWAWNEFYPDIIIEK